MVKITITCIHCKEAFATTEAKDARRWNESHFRMCRQRSAATPTHRDGGRD